MEKERIVFLDAIKAVAIFLVVFCHYVTLSADTIVGNAIMSLAWCAVPCFFMVTGSLLHSKKEFSIKKHLTKILITYLVTCCWKLVYLIFYCVLEEIHFSKSELFEYILLFGDIENVNVGHIWFMYAYMCVLLFAPISYYIMKSDNSVMQSYTLILLFLGGIGIPAAQFLCTTFSKIVEVNSINIKGLLGVFPFCGYINMFFYFFAGGLIYKNKEKIEKRVENEKVKKILPIVIIFSGILGNMVVKYTYTKSFQWQGSFLVEGYNRFSTMLMALGIYMLCYFVRDCKLVKMLAKYIGKETMGIYYLHWPILNVFSILFFPYLSFYYSVSLNSIKTVVVMILCVFSAKIIKKIPYFSILVK